MRRHRARPDSKWWLDLLAELITTGCSPRPSLGVVFPSGRRQYTSHDYGRLAEEFNDELSVESRSMLG